jgi:glycosyltransferase involved in cell wall biosynthesis
MERVAMPDISFITTCKGRLNHLKQTLPRLVTQPNCECIVVDYDCPDGTANWVQQHFPSVTVVHVEHASRFHKSHAQNLGIATSTAPWLCLIDADILIDTSFKTTIAPYLGNGIYLRPRPMDWNAYGSLVCARESIENIEGYDEIIEGFGCEDDDLYYRLEMGGVRLATFPGDLLVGIPHDNETRTRHYEIKDHSLNQRINALYANIKHDLMRQAMGKNISLEIRRLMYDEVRRVVLNESAMSGSGMARVEVTLPVSSSVPLHQNWTIQRKWIFDLARIRSQPDQYGSNY